MFDTVHDRFKVLEPFLQKHVNFCVNHKITRKGKLLLYNINDYYVKFMINTNKDVNKLYEVPYPFEISCTDSFVKFSYKIHDFCRGNLKKEQLIRQIKHDNNKFYDQEIIIHKQF